MRKMLQHTVMAAMAVWALSMVQSQMGASTDTLTASAGVWVVR
ncbi:hypothetical protein [Aquabacterium fontiphilum]|nr:hypothetical protein [Aquabacterium fontiphilum]